MNQLEEIFKGVITSDSLIKIIFSAKRRKSLEFSKVSMRPVKIREGILIQLEYTYPKKVIQENLSMEQGVLKALSLTNDCFKQVNIFTSEEDIQILAAKPEKPKIQRTCASRGVPTLEHNQKKNYIIEENSPCDFLIRLGVMDKNGKVLKKHYNKFRQINRYLEIVEDVFPYLPTDKELKIIDFGCGKAYLTFALYYYLKVLKNRNVKIIGLDLKKDVVAFCQKVATDLNYEGLSFLTGDIADYTNDSADMVVTLHACDTATDYALINAVSWNTKVILCVPCCQHELFKQIKDPIHQPMLKHGILKDRLTEYLTDGLRALKLESRGYEVALIEFTSLEHTARNIMIKAIKSYPENSPKAEKAEKEYEALRDFYHVNPTIEQL